MEIQQLRYFARAAELSSFTRAAEACFITQPTLSQQILKLEQELGQPLFERLGRSVKLTEAGKILKERADQILALMEDAAARITDQPDAGRLVIGAIPTIAPYLLPRLIDRFSKMVPKADLEIVEDVTPVLLKKCQSGEVDLAFMALPLEASGLKIKKLFTEKLRLVMKLGHPLAAKACVSLDAAIQEPFLLLHDAHCLAESTISYCRQKNVIPLGTSRLSQLSTIIELVALGQGVTLVPEMAVPRHINNGCAYRQLDGEQPMRTVVLIWNDYRFATKLFTRFVKWAEQELAKK
jgi:LysR family hydrogen peroxide-inducible transcriptional activator